MDIIHKWKGAIANLTKIEIIAIIDSTLDIDTREIIIIRRNITDEKAWTLKYLTIALDDDSFISWNSQIKPINLNRFNSIINQILNKE